MNINGFFISITISFIIISIIILLLIVLLNNNFESFTSSSNDSNDLNNSLITFKFNTEDINNNLIINKGGLYTTNAINNNCLINTNDYIDGTGSIQFTGNSYIQLPMTQLFNNDTFSIGFYIKVKNFNNQKKTIASHCFKNPTLGWLIQIDNNDLKVIIGTNKSDEWTTIITVPNFTNPSKIDWSQVVLTYDKNASQKWNLYINSDRYQFQNTDNPNLTFFGINNEVAVLINNNVTPTIPNDSMNKLLIGANNDNSFTSIYSYDELKQLYNLYKINITGNGTYTNWFSADKEFLYIKFTNGYCTLISPIDCVVDVLIVGGGGGGGFNCGGEGGGGGGGGAVGIGIISLNMGKSYEIKVGDGGIGATINCTDGNNGDFSSIIGDDINEIANGGGGGGSKVGHEGGSGGGSSGYNNNNYGGTAILGTSSSKNMSAIMNYYGNNGGFAHSSAGGSGGGGAGNPGFSTLNNGNYRGTAGGAGIIWPIDGNRYAGGGGGAGGIDGGNAGGNGGNGGGGIGAHGSQYGNVPAGNGHPNTGGGGGGGNNYYRAGNGGSGIVILRFRTAYFNFNNQNIYKFNNTNITPIDFLPENTLIDDFRIYNYVLTIQQIKTLYYGTLVANAGSVSTTMITSDGNIDCVNNSALVDFNGITYPSSQSKLMFVSSITTIINNSIFNQFKQTFTVMNDNEIQENYELLFSEIVETTTTPNPYSPVKLFDKNTNTLNDNINYCSFLSKYPKIKSLPNNERYIYNYDTDGSYALDFTVPDCGNINFTSGNRPRGDYIYIKTPTEFVLNRYTFIATKGFINRAPKTWTLYIYNSKNPSSGKIAYPNLTPVINNNYCNNNNRAFIIDINYSNQQQKIASNEYLFVFHSIIGNSDNERYGILSLEQIILSSSFY